MRVFYHPDFSKDLLRFGKQYGDISAALKNRFRTEVGDALAAIKTNPTSAGHSVEIEKQFSAQLRRRNLRKFPFFVLYAFDGERLVFGAVLPSRSDPLTWLARWQK